MPETHHDPSIPDGCGFVFAATGETYITLARRAARSLRAIHPDAEIDLFTDADPGDTVFSDVHILSESWFRPKMEALRTSRFERTLFLDADVMVIASLAPVFEVLERFDVAAAQDRYGASTAGLLHHTRAMPPAFPALNSGVLAMRRTPDTAALLAAWEHQMKDTGAKRDQPVLRELLYDSDLRVCTLPPGYNLLSFNELTSWWGMFGAPRVLHSPKLHKGRGGAGDPETPYTMAEVVGAKNAERIKHLLHADPTVTPEAAPGTRRQNDPLEGDGLRGLRRRLAPYIRKLKGH